MKEKRISAGTITRTILLGMALFNQVLTMAGHSPIPIEDEAIHTIVTTGWTVAASILAWWKNNSFTQAALSGDMVKDRLKNGEA
jgi:SPP1 family holin